jgi:hypothetical protein
MSQRTEEEIGSLFIKFYFDEDVSVGIVNNLRNRGFDVLCARDVAMLGRDDDAQLKLAVSQGRAFVTHNRHDFEVRHHRYLDEGARHHGIVIAKRRSRDEITVARLLDLLNSVTADEMQMQLRYV